MDKRKETLIKAMQDSNEEVRKAAAEAMEKHQVRQRLDFLEEKLTSGEMLEKIRAVYAITDMKGTRIIELLTKALKDPAEDVRAAAVRALGEMSDAGAVPILVEALNDASPMVARSSVDALGKYNDPRALGPLMKALKNPDAGVVEKAIEAIGRYGDKRTEEAMLHFAVSGNEKMRSLALKALGTMEG